MHHHTEFSFVDEFRWVSSLHYLKNNGWQNSALLWCMLQAEPPSLHYYCAVVLQSCIVLPPVGRSSNHQYHWCQLRDNRAVFQIFISLLNYSFDSPLYSIIFTKIIIFVPVNFYLNLPLATQNKVGSLISTTLTKLFLQCYLWTYSPSFQPVHTFRLRIWN